MFQTQLLNAFVSKHLNPFFKIMSFKVCISYERQKHISDVRVIDRLIFHFQIFHLYSLHKPLNQTFNLDTYLV